MLRDQAVEIIGVLADSRDDIAHRKAFAAQPRHRTDRLIEALAARQPADREHQLVVAADPQACAQVLGVQPRAEHRHIDAGINDGNAGRGDAHGKQGGARMLAIGDDPVGMAQGKPHGLVFAAATPAGELLAVGIDDHRAPGQPCHRPRHQSFGQRAEGMDRIEAVGQRQRQRLEEKACVHRQRLGAQPGHTLEVQAMNGVGVLRVDRRRIRHLGGDDMDFLAAEAFVHLGRPYGGAALGRQKQFGQHQQAVQAVTPSASTARCAGSASPGAPPMKAIRRRLRQAAGRFCSRRSPGCSGLFASAPPLPA